MKQRTSTGDYLFDLHGDRILRGALTPAQLQAINAGVDAQPPLERGEWLGHVQAHVNTSAAGSILCLLAGVLMAYVVCMQSGPLGRSSRGGVHRAPPHRRGVPIKYARVLATLRQRILAGKLQVGDRLPSHEALSIEFQTTRVTVQKALDRLRIEGLVRAEGARGTFVAATKPQAQQYALAFPWPQNYIPSNFFTAIYNEAVKLQQADRQVLPFYGIGAARAEEDYQRLRGFVEAHRLAGLIFAANPRAHPSSLEGTPLLTEPHVARVAIEAAAGPAGIPSVYPDLPAFRREAVAELQRQGRRRVAHLLLAGWGWQTTRDAVRHDSAACGLELPEAWVQGAPAEAPDAARYIVEQWWREPQATRPDALVIHDDNLVPEATRGLVAAGARVPDEIVTVAHTNFPWPTPAAVPVQRLGFAMDELLAICFERLEQQRRGETASPLILLPPRWAAAAKPKVDVQGNPSVVCVTAAGG